MATLTPTPTSLSFFSSSLFLSSSSSKLPPLSLSCKTSSKPSLSISSQLSTLPILSFTGEKIGETYLDLKSAPPETSRAVVHRAIITDQQNKRRGTASTLTRGEVRGGGRKPYPQKSTGRARRGSTRTPLRPGGGVVFGPRPRDWSIKINKKEKRLAISTALSSAAENTIVVEDFGDKFEKPKTKDFIEALKRWGLDPKQKSMFLMMEVPENVNLSSRNIGTLRMLTPRTLNLFDILNCDNLVLTPDTVDFLNGRYGENYEGDTEDDDEEGEEEEEGGEGKVFYYYRRIIVNNVALHFVSRRIDFNVNMAYLILEDEYGTYWRFRQWKPRYVWFMRMLVGFEIGNVKLVLFEN